MTRRLSLLLLSLLCLGCPGQTPQPSSTASPAKSPAPVASAAPTQDEFTLRLSAGASPGWFGVTWRADGQVQLAWEGGQLSYQLSSDANTSMIEAAALAVEEMAGYQSPDIPPYRTLTHRSGAEVQEIRLGDGEPPAVTEFVERLSKLLPRERGVGDGYAVGSVQHQDLEGGFYQLVVSQDQTLVLQGEVKPEFDQKQVLVAGKVSDAPSLQMSGPGLELTDLTLWPPPGGFWQGENVPKGLRP